MSGVESAESDGLLASQTSGKKPDSELSVSEIMNNFWIMTIPFSVVNGAYTVLYSYVSSVYALELASYSSGASYLTYMVSALLFAALFVDAFGPHKMMIFSQACFASFSLCLIVALWTTNYDAQWFLLMLGSILKGFGSPIGWVSQGVYFATYAELYAKKSSSTILEANGLLAGYFATSRIGIQGIFYLLSSILLEFTHLTDQDLFIVFGLMSFAALASVVLFLQDLPMAQKVKKELPTCRELYERVMPVLTMAVTDLVAICVSPLTISFGCLQIFMFVYVNEKVASDNFPVYTVGYLNVIYTAVNVLVSIPVAIYCSRTTAVVIGAVAYLLLAIAFMSFTDDQLGVSQYIWMLYVLYGIARMSWESTTKAIYADLYPDNRSVAFAHLSFLNGLSSGIFSFLVGNMSGLSLGVCLFVPAVLMVPGYLMALRLRE